ncbi:endonuclease/exonuclease/phosphatase family protein [Pseudokineococcus sp. 1T1Z-3]|uniref:endonuclease/exonuclease/phosphatase family protein n=1 Tax=Pseudokineococcus sp. 1T1Z-3 TaxID=3132745 RepID=UPI0030AC80E6
MGLAIAWAAALVVGIGALVSLAPARVGLSMTTPWAQLVTLRSGSAAAALALGLLLLLVAVAVRWRRRDQLRRWPLPLLALVAALAVTAVGHAALLLVRDPPPGAAGAGVGGALPDRRDGDLVVTAFNVGPEGTTAADVVDLAARRGSDVLALTEADAQLARDVAAGLADLGQPMQVFSSPEVERPPLEWRLTGLLLPFVATETQLLVAQSLGDYVAEAEPGPPALLGGAVVVRPSSGDGPPLAAVHTLPAVPVLFSMTRWREETTAALATCDRLEGGVLAGDLNATPDHAVLRQARCVDASGEGGTSGTWPVGLPALLGAPIDHVMLDPAAWRGVGTALDEVGASDHRALTAVLRPGPG